MAYSKEIVTRARQRLEQLRADRESENAARLQLAYDRVPRLKAIDIQLRASVALAAQAVFSGDAVAAIEKARQENLSLQEERRALEEANFEPGFLEAKPLCALCGGTGYVGSNMCQCLKSLCMEEQRKELSRVFTGNETFETFRLDYYSDAVIPQLRFSPRGVMEKNLDTCRRYARSFADHSGNLLMGGGPGLGKTHLALAIGRAVGEQGYTVCYETAAGLFNKLERAKFSPNEENLRKAQELEDCDLLIIDDLGTEMAGQFVTAALYGLMNQRLMDQRSMIITTNLTVDEVGKRYSPQIASRLYGEFTRLTFLGEDIRILKNRGMSR